MNPTTPSPTTFDSPTLADIEKLFESEDNWCVSIYMPTHRSGKEIREDPIRLKNRLAEAEEQLKKAGVESGEIDRLCKLAQARCNLDTDANREFWRHQADGLAILLNDGEEQVYQLQMPVDELTLVSHRFHLKPLLRAAQSDLEYCVLAVSQGKVRFLEGSRSGLSERPIEDLPAGLQSIVSGDHQKGFNMHSFKVASGGGENAVPHGHVETDQEHELRRYFRIIDEAIGEALHADSRPLVFAGVDELFPYFRDASEYSHLIEEPIGGNPDELSAEELHQKAWPLVAKQFHKREHQALERWNSVAHTDTAEDSVEAILNAAHDGRIDTLLLKAGSHCWGKYDASIRETTIEEQSSANNYDLFDLAAIKTLQADGRVELLEEESLPKELPAAAICRYAAS
ncbi:hypothetical protein Pla110_17970 [Polystyrenella longa]|uniref:Uncharacterized protein n=1 Tax=Polystyrenella longa TaxID=2528007 RepID=A0A518CLG5_9PLAN|nr:hypothetical protein [Polystyrenella longa]QDU80075.1 hypothetical protein Pla110_17970 [Polystyrenella longa]